MHKNKKMFSFHGLNSNNDPASESSRQRPPIRHIGCLFLYQLPETKYYIHIKAKLMLEIKYDLASLNVFEAAWYHCVEKVPKHFFFLNVGISTNSDTIINNVHYPIL